MSPRTKRQSLRKAAGYMSKPYELFPEEPTAKAKKTNARPSRRRREQSATSSAKSKDVLDTDPLPNLGMPSRTAYQGIEREYIASLHARKREKALLTQELFDKIWDVLHDPGAARVGTPQFRWWVRKMFVLSYTRTTLSPAEMESLGAESTPVVLHENRPVALKDQIYDVLCYCHDLATHGGRDKTTAVIREHYSWIPKELIAQFVKACPTCTFKKTGSLELALAMNVKGEATLSVMTLDEAVTTSLAEAGERTPAEELDQPAIAQRIALPVSNLIRSGTSPAPENLIKGWSDSSGHIVSPVPLHPMPILQPWPDSACYNTQDTCYLSSSLVSRGSTLVPDQLSNLGFRKGFQELPPIRRLGNADDTYEPVGLRSHGRSVNLPPLMQVLSEDACEAGVPSTRPQLNTPNGYSYSYSGFPESNARWYREGYDDRFGPSRSSSRATQHEPGYLPPIDPALLPENDGSSGDGRPYSAMSPGRAMASYGGLQVASPERGPYTTLVSPPPMGSQRTMASIDSLFAASNSLGTLTLDSGPSGAEGHVFSPQVYAVRATEPGVQDTLHPSRFIFPPSLELQYPRVEEESGVGRYFMAAAR